MKLIKIEKEFFFSQELALEIDTVSKDDNKLAKKNALKKLKNEYKSLAKEIKPLVKENIQKTKEKYQKLEKEVEDDFQKHMEELNSVSRSTKAEKHEYNELLSGISIKRKRALKNLVRDRLQEEIDCKRAFIELRVEYTKLASKIGLKQSLGDLILTEHIESSNTKLLEKTLRDRNFWLSKISLFSFAVLAILYILVCLAGGIKIEYERILEGSSIIIAVALGGVFIYSMRSFDMSLGGGTAVAAALGGLVWQSTENIFLVLIVGICVGIIVELINSALASVLKLPVMVTTLAMSSVLSAILTNILETTATQTIRVTHIRHLDTFAFYFGVILLLFLITAFIFKATPVGRKNKMIGANSKSSKFSGVNITKQGLITFTIAGIAIGFGAMLYLVKSRTVSASSCSTIGLDVILAIVFGGMQTTGGPKSKISAAILGGLTATLISYLLIAIGRVANYPAITHYDSFAKGALFLIIVSVNTIGERTNRLPAIEMLW